MMAADNTEKSDCSPRSPSGGGSTATAATLSPEEARPYLFSSLARCRAVVLYVVGVAEEAAGDQKLSSSTRRRGGGQSATSGRGGDKQQQQYRRCTGGGKQQKEPASPVKKKEVDKFNVLLG